MAHSLPRDRLATIEEYFAFEDASPTRHEYVHGQVHAMSGVTRQHSRLTMNIAGRFWVVARGGPCRVHRGDVKLRLDDIIYYPDVMLACGPEPSDTRVEDAPSVVFEVLSPSTERVDRGEKLIMYRQAPSLVMYVIVDQERRWVERHWRDARGEWRHEVLTEAGQKLTVLRPALTLTLHEIYEGVELPSPEERLRRLRLREEAASYG